MRFGTSSTGVDVEKVTLSAGDLTVSILTWGAILQDVRIAGVDHSLTLGSDDLADYEGTLRHHGSLIGPIVNRISNGRIKIDRMMYELERNGKDGIHLHSGAQATQRRAWTLVDTSDTHATLTCALPDGECGLPGNRMITVTYRVSAPATLSMEITGTTDATTAMNFANHSYWNLDGSEKWDGHTLQINADAVLPSTPLFYPTGEILDVTDTAYDFRKPRTITADANSFDNNFCLADHRRPLHDAVTLTGKSGLSMSMATTEPGVQVYDNKSGARPGKSTYEGIAIEAQFWPDAPNQPAFPSILVTPDETYTQVTTWTFTR
ncbi:aldose 1-epimerase [Loktanella ponticola]|uniref:Aldose 1-epimerase n=1 Tax=Yoonia ponticola TaxID=1524255 RepID=A0A7W9BIH0_9RHOB|nr:aldose epimerase family protein [Yoonia ponticola]MBB5721071.1 aldose 1-epimerase [Yoonia ponticola]